MRACVCVFACVRACVSLSAKLEQQLSYRRIGGGVCAVGRVAAIASRRQDRESRRESRENRTPRIEARGLLRFAYQCRVSSDDCSYFYVGTISLCLIPFCTGRLMLLRFHSRYLRVYSKISIRFTARARGRRPHQTSACSTREYLPACAATSAHGVWTKDVAALPLGSARRRLRSSARP